MGDNALIVRLWIRILILSNHNYSYKNPSLSTIAVAYSTQKFSKKSATVIRSWWIPALSHKKRQGHMLPFRREAATLRYPKLEPPHVLVHVSDKTFPIFTSSRYIYGNGNPREVVTPISILLKSFRLRPFHHLRFFHYTITSRHQQMFTARSSCHIILSWHIRITTVSQ